MQNTILWVDHRYKERYIPAFRYRLICFGVFFLQLSTVNKCLENETLNDSISKRTKRVQILSPLSEILTTLRHSPKTLSSISKGIFPVNTRQTDGIS